MNPLHVLLFAIGFVLASLWEMVLEVFA